MNHAQRMTLWAGLVAVGVVLGALYTLGKKEEPVTVTGVVIRQDSDPQKQAPISNVEITADDAVLQHDSKSDSSGLFHLSLRPGVTRNQLVTLIFRHPDYKPITLTQPIGNILYVIRMLPNPRAATPAPAGPKKSISDVLVSYSVKASAAVEVGSAVKTFQVTNTGNISCRGQMPCSPDGKWRAAEAVLSLDAGEGNQLRNPRVSCIAGPCPFTKIDTSGLAEGNRVFRASVRDWSDATTFLVEAEIVHQMTGDINRQTHPVILGRNLDFSLPAGAEGVSIEAEVDGSRVVFPLGPDLCLSWAECSMKVEKDHSNAYRCELLPNVEFH